MNIIKLFCLLSLTFIFPGARKGLAVRAVAIESPGFTQGIFGYSRQIPVLCYHNIKKNPAKEDPLWISETRLNQQMKMFSDSGYHTILPDQLYHYVNTGATLPAKPILLSFDDTHAEDFSIVAPILARYGYKGVFFTMTVCIGKNGFMSAAEIKTLSDSGHIIGGHTWNHPNITTVKGKEWEQQIDKPKLLLEKITGKTVNYFAYPYGAWNDAAIMELKKRGINAAFQLTGKQSEKEPLFTIRRLMISGSWTGVELLKRMEKIFPKND
jgi:peptidoglycan/xylan/chitin deacetylase (PgdA/CDA1 family)